MGTSHLDIVDISDDSNDVECEDMERDERLGTEKDLMFDDAVSEKTKIEIDVDYKEKKNDCFESTLVFILSSQKKYRLLEKMILSCSIAKEEIPQQYNGNCVYELPPASKNKPMEGMEQKYDGHVWVKSVSIKMSFPATIRRSKCAGHLICNNGFCHMKALSGQSNAIAWTGKLSTPIGAEGMTSLASGTLACFHCGNVATLLRECQCVAYYILAEDNKS